ncbi:MAG: hypothetical protein IBX72_16365 [Nitrospirae bacterium]|nr:hypothetical protein [Nitrospirota bacterium]
MVRVKFDDKYVFAELKKVGNVLTSPVILYLIGGAAMIKYGLKTATKDIDILLSTREETAELIQALLKSGYHKSRPIGLVPNIKRCWRHRYLKMKMGSDGIYFMNMYAENSDCQQG